MTPAESNVLCAKACEVGLNSVCGNLAEVAKQGVGLVHSTLDAAARRAALEDVAFLRYTVRDQNSGIASGGLRTWSSARAMISAGGLSCL